MQNLHAIRQQTTQIARDAGKLIMKHYGKPHQIDFKGTHDVVTEADKAAENLIIPALSAAYPSHHFVGEEGGHTGAPLEEAEYRWYIDPIDGTTNFANNIPHFCTSIALADANNQPLLGVIYDPNRDEIFVAERGVGATMNDIPIQTTPTDDLNLSVMSTGFPYDRVTGENNFAQFAHFAPRVRGIRRFGSAALDIAWVACGRLDAYWEWRIHRWDFFAGWLIVEEAGGQISDFAGKQSKTLNSGAQVLATNGALHAQIVAGMQSTMEPTAG
jgi:myo-inositol-1(or 4)-monophosphatase